MASTQRNNTPIIVGAVAVVALLAIIAAIVAGMSEKSDDSTGRETVPYQQVVATGAPLPVYSDENGQTPNPAAGATAPVLTGKNFFGDPLTIGPSDKYKVVMFMAHWCPHCQKELPLVADWFAANASKYPTVEFIAVATATTPTRPNYPPAPWFEKEGFRGPILVDDKQTSAATAYGLGSYPFFVFLDPQHKVVTRTAGEISMTDFERFVQQMTAPPAPK